MCKSGLFNSLPRSGHSLVPAVLACAVAAAAGSCLLYPEAAGATGSGGRQPAAGIEAGAIAATGLDTDAGRGQRMQELRRQLLEHDRHWRGAASGSIVDSRLSERERLLLREQLLQVGRPQALRGDR